MRVLLGDVPIDWSKITDFCQWLAISQQRNHHFASVVKKQVLANGRRALLLKGLDAFVRPNAVEQVTGERVYAIVDLAYAASDPGGVGRQLAQYPRFTVIPAAGTWLGSADAGLLFGDIGPPAPRARMSRDRVAGAASRTASQSNLGAGTATRAAAPTAANRSNRSSMPASISARQAS